MRNKILIVGVASKEKEELETILQEIADEGGEIFFADTKEEGLAILKKERPQLVFLDENLSAEWSQDLGELVLISKKFKGDQILEKCRQVLPKEAVLRIPPM